MLEPADARELSRELRRPLRAEMRDLGVRGLGGGGALGGRGGVGLRLRRLGPQRGDLALELAPTRLELEQNRLGRLAGEPELSALRVVAEPFVGHRRNLRGEQRVEGDDGQLGDAVGRRRPHEHCEAAEPCVARPPQQRQAGGGIVRDDRGRTPRERGGDGSLLSGLDIEE